MGCKPTLNMSSSEDKIRFYGKFITKTRLNYMENAPLVKNELENNPVGWNTFIIDRLKKLDENHLWQSYTSDLIHFLEEKPLEQYMRPINSKSWLSLVGK